MAAEVALVFSDGRLKSFSVAPEPTVVVSMTVDPSVVVVDSVPLPETSPPHAPASNAPINPIADVNKRVILRSP
jgi:hypothetical protein